MHYIFSPKIQKWKIFGKCSTIELPHIKTLKGKSNHTTLKSILRKFEQHIMKRIAWIELLSVKIVPVFLNLIGIVAISTYRQRECTIKNK